VVNQSKVKQSKARLIKNVPNLGYLEICICFPLNTGSISACRTRAALNSSRENTAWCDRHVLLNQLHYSTLLQTGLLGKVGHSAQTRYPTKN